MAYIKIFQLISAIISISVTIKNSELGKALKTTKD